MSRVETAMTIGSSIAASIFSHVFCCGILPLALNASASALLGGLGAQLVIAVVTLVAVATGVTYFEKHRHETACAASGCCGCHTVFHFKRHFLRNLAIGAVTYSFFYVLTHLPAIHEVLEHNFGI